MQTRKRRAIAAVLAVVTLWLAPSAAFAAMPSSHSCASAHSGVAVVSASAPHSGAPCQHTELFGCPTGACAGPAVVLLNRVDAAALALGVAVETPRGATHRTGPRSAPPTPPPNS